MEVLNKQGRLEIPKFEVKEKNKARNEREEITEYFQSAVNGDLVRSGRKARSFMFYKKHLEHVTTDELYPFWKSCREYERSGKGPFSKYYFGRLKVKK